MNNKQKLKEAILCGLVVESVPRFTYNQQGKNLVVLYSGQDASYAAGDIAIEYVGGEQYRVCFIDVDDDKYCSTPLSLFEAKKLVEKLNKELWTSEDNAIDIVTRKFKFKKSR